MTSANDKPMSPEEAAAIKALDGHLEKADMHEVVRDVLFLIQDPRTQTWYPKMTMEIAQPLVDRMNTVPVPERPKAVFDVLRLCTALWRDPAAKQMGVELYAMCERLILTYKIVVKKDAEFDGGHLDKVVQAVGSTKRAMPSKVGDSAPEGSVKGGAMAPKRRI